MVELIKTLNQTPSDYLVGYLIFTVIVISIIVSGLVEITKHLFRKKTNTPK